MLQLSLKLRLLGVLQGVFLDGLCCFLNYCGFGNRARLIHSGFDGLNPTVAFLNSLCLLRLLSLLLLGFLVFASGCALVRLCFSRPNCDLELPAALGQWPFTGSYFGCRLCLLDLLKLVLLHLEQILQVLFVFNQLLFIPLVACNDLLVLSIHLQHLSLFTGLQSNSLSLGCGYHPLNLLYFIF